MSPPAKPVGKSRSTSCTVKSRNPIAAADSHVLNVACAWANCLVSLTASSRSVSRAPSTPLLLSASTLRLRSGQVLTLRHALAALSRRCWATAQLTGELLAHLEWWRAYYHFCRPHLSLRLKAEVPLARRGKQTPRHFQPRTPAMAAGLTDHVWSVQELLAFPVGQ